jgi:alpha-glucuronidase
MTDSHLQLKTMLAGLLSILSSAACADDGHRLWLRYDPLQSAQRKKLASHASELVIGATGSTASAAAAELSRGLDGLLAARVPVRSRVDRDGAILVALANSPAVLKLHLQTQGLGSEGFLIRSARVNAHLATLVVANDDAGLLYGVFAFLRRIQLHQQLREVNVHDRPVLPLRMLDHWDNLDRSVERGYAGRSIWDWQRLPDASDPRYVDYARANASIGINATVLNNVNADPRILTDAYLGKVVALAGILRPYKIRVYLSVRFSSPIETGGIKTADPLDPAVQAWWRKKADEIYRLIPDFGGFVVKANSEGQPGPQDYHRTHADGANVIADALKSHGGTLIWRAFVYGSSDKDRAMQAYDEFRPLDGEFRDNVILQVKNGPIDFQPREPFHPLFGQMPHTRLAFEAQITREYLGQNTGVVYLAPMWTEALNADTCAPRCGNPVSGAIGAMAGVSNIGTDTNWTGTNFDQANWFAYGRLAWNPRLGARQIANEWISLTWSNNPRVAGRIANVMLGSRETVVDFMTPLGLAHQMATDHHYGPAPWVCDLKQPSWNPCYYSRADAHGIGFDRVTAKDTVAVQDRPPNAVSQYMPPVRAKFANLATIPDEYLLWFHHVPWDYRMRSGRTLWDELINHYDRGLAGVARMNDAWTSLRPHIDAGRWEAVASDLRREQAEARWWRDASVAYWSSIATLPLPRGSRKFAHPLTYYEVLKPPGLPGQRP